MARAFLAVALLAGCAGSASTQARPAVPAAGLESPGQRACTPGESIPLETLDPRYQDYYNQIRERIKSVWVYPYEASSRSIEGEATIGFGIAKSGELQYVRLCRSSGTKVLDDSAMRAVQKAGEWPSFPPVPDAISKGALPISGIFRYHIIPASGQGSNQLR